MTSKRPSRRRCSPGVLNYWPGAESQRPPTVRPDARNAEAARNECRALYREALAQPRLDAPPGYCTACGTIRLSADDRRQGTVCAGCRRMTDDNR